MLDEPSLGLDLLVRRDILAAIIRTITEDGRTVLFSSHLLEEVERVADHVAMIHQGRIVFDAPLDEIKATHRRLTLRFAEAAPVAACAGPGAGRGRGRARVDGGVRRSARRAAGGGRGGGGTGRRRTIPSPG